MPKKMSKETYATPKSAEQAAAKKGIKATGTKEMPSGRFVYVSEDATPHYQNGCSKAIAAIQNKTDEAGVKLENAGVTRIFRDGDSVVVAFSDGSKMTQLSPERPGMDYVMATASGVLYQLDIDKESEKADDVNWLKKKYRSLGWK